MKTLNKLLIIGFTAFVLAALLQISPVSAASCNVDADCGGDYWENQFCQDNAIRGTYIDITCIKPSGTSVGICSTPQKENKLVYTCASSQTCKQINSNAFCSGPVQPSPNPNPPPPAPNPNPTPYTYHYYTRCDAGNSIYWFDSNNTRQDLYQTCSSGSVCSGNSCGTGYNPPPPYTPPYNAHQLKGCVANKSYWYDSLGVQKELFKNCSLTGQTCSDGSCIGPVVYPAPAPKPPSPNPTTPGNTGNQNGYALHYVTKCHEDNLYWFDSKDAVQTMFMSCSDNNQCTTDSCADGQCKHELKCDGTTCSATSDDYAKYCAGSGIAAVSENGFGDFMGNWLIWIILAIAMIILFVIIFRRLSKNN